MKKDKTMTTGCSKPRDSVIRNPREKYYMPTEIYPKKFWVPYYSGAAYVFTGKMALKVIYKM